MLFWVIAALLTLGASLAVLLPLAGRSATRAVDGAHDLEVYRDQLAELDRDAARGLIGRPKPERRAPRSPGASCKADKAGQPPRRLCRASRGARAIGAIAPCWPCRW